MASLDATVDLLHLLGDPTRVRLLALLAREELSVAELVSVTQLSQSRVSTHLGRLREAGLLRDRRVGSSTFYTSSDAAMPAQARSLWQLVEAQVSDGVLELDRRRCEALKSARDANVSWPDSIAGEMERHYSPGRTWEATARGLLPFVRLGDALDVGSGDGAITELLAPRARSITCLDKSERMIAAARRRLSDQGNVRFEVGDMHALPFEDASFDEVLLFNTLTYALSPRQALAEAARVLRPGGATLIVTLHAHRHEDLTSTYSHLHPGFEAAALSRLLEDAGLDVRQCGVTSRERRKPYFEVLTAFGRRPARARSDAPRAAGEDDRPRKTATEST